MAEFNIPTETVELPSKGLLYPEDSPLASGTIEMKYMTAKEEDILTNTNYIKQGTAINKLLQSLIVDKSIKFNDLLIGDKNAIMLAARILSYGKDYSVNYNDEEIKIDLSKIKEKEVDLSKFKDRKNEFSFTLPKSGNSLTFKLLTQKDEESIDREIKGLQKINKTAQPDVTTRLKHMITSINGSSEQKDIRAFVDNYLLAQDARELRKAYMEVNPDLNLVFKYEDSEGREEEVSMPIGLNFFWPDL
jgi:plasmid maintenance system killer protein